MAVISRGLEGIIAAETRIGDVRGDIGQLIYCGYDINELAGKVSYEEVVHLLWHNRLPNQRELDALTTALRAERELPRGVLDFITTAPRTAAPIDIMRTVVSMLGCYPTVRHDLDMSESQAIAIKLSRRSASWPRISTAPAAASRCPRSARTSAKPRISCG